MDAIMFVQHLAFGSLNILVSRLRGAETELCSHNKDKRRAHKQTNAHTYALADSNISLFLPCQRSQPTPPGR